MKDKNINLHYKTIYPVYRFVYNNKTVFFFIANLYVYYFEFITNYNMIINNNNKNQFNIDNKSNTNLL